MSKHEYEITIPVAGHAYITVIAESESEALEIAMDEVSEKDIDSWEFLEQFNQGNVCYCPRPWTVVVDDVGEVEE